MVRGGTTWSARRASAKPRRISISGYLPQVCKRQRKKALTVRKFFFDMKDGVPFRDRVGIDFSTNAEAITHCKEMAKYYRDNGLRDDQDLEITVVNEIGREIFRQFVHREPE
jgi:hypothetical protein